MKAYYPVQTSVPLTMVSSGERMKIVKVAAGRRATHRLAELGLTPGSEMEVIQDCGFGPLLLAVRDTRLAIERGIAHKVMVQPAVQEQPRAMFSHQAQAM